MRSGEEKHFGQRWTPLSTKQLAQLGTAPPLTLRSVKLASVAIMVLKVTVTQWTLVLDISIDI